MNNISGDNEIYSGAGLVQQQGQRQEPHNKLDLDDFLELMITELTHQDPFKPMENSELATQMSQFATVSGIGDLNQEMTSLVDSLTADQGLKAANLVGHQVMVPLNTGHLSSGGSVSGAVKLDSSVSNLVLRVTSAGGALVREIELGTGSEGEVDFTWDGFTDSGSAALPGQYRLSVEGEVDGEPFAPPMLLAAKVNSVSLGAPGQGVALNLEGLGPIAIQDVAEIR